MFNDKNKLRQYLNEIELNKKNNIQFNNIRMDISSCKEILRYFNANYPGINVHNDIMEINEFINHIKEISLNNNEHRRFIVNAGRDRTHFAAANVFKDMNNNISIIFVDSSRGKNQYIFSMLSLHSDLKKISNIKTLYIYSQIQNSDADCLLFSLHFLKKMHKHHSHFEKLHQDIFNEKIAFIKENNAIFNPPPVLGEESLKKARVVFFDQAIKLLPIDFFKHAQSINPINAYLTSHPDEVNKKVNKKVNQWQDGETLTERYNRHQVTRVIDNKQRTYSNSIEEKRLRFTLATLRWLGEDV
jgi:YopJ family protease